MTDRAFEPANPDPFGQFDPDSPSYAPAGRRKPRENDPFAEFDKYPDEDITGFTQPKQPESSALGAFGRGAARNVAPAVGGLAAVPSGAALGLQIGALGGPLAPVTEPLGALIGGGAAFFGGSAAVSAAQHWALSKLPDSWKDALGLDDAQERADNAAHPTASFLGGLAPYAVTMTPMGLAKQLPENATAFQRLMLHPATARVFGGTVMGGLELGQEAWHGESPDWTKVAISTGFGVIFNRPNRIGEAISRVGAAPVLALRPRPPVEAPAVETAPAASPGAPEAIPQAAPAEAAPPPPKVTAEDWRKEITERTRTGRPYELPPTVAQANDMGIMGPGATEETFLGSHVRNPEATQAARENAQTEQDVIGPAPVTDLHSRARQLDFDSFQRRDELVARRDTLEAWLGERHDVAAEGAVTKAQEHLAAIEAELAEVQPNIAAAYRRAEETVTRRPAPPETVAAEPPTGGPIAPGAAEAAEPRFSIAKDVEERLVAAGRPLEEARAHAAWSEAYWQNYASRFEGRKGTAEDIYRREAPEILGERASRLLRKSARGPRKVDEEKLSLEQFLAHRGGIQETGDTRVIYGGKNKVVPGFGSLFRKGGMPLDRAREAAVEAGYLWDDPNRAGGGETRVNDLLRLLDQEAKGSKVFRVGREDLAAAKHDPDEVRAQYESHVTGQLEEAGVPTEMITPERLNRTIELMESGSETAEEAFDHAVMKEDLPEREHEDDLVPMFQREGKSERRLSIGHWRMTKRQAERELISRNESLERYREEAASASDPDAARIAGMMARQNERIIKEIEDALPKFDADLPRGKPFAKAKVVEAGDRYAVSVATDERHGATDSEKTFKIYRKPEGGLETVQTPSRDLGRPLGQVSLARHPDGRWEVQMVEVGERNRGQGVATALYNTVEKEIGQEMAPSGILLPDGYAYWKKRNPELVEYHRPHRYYYASPKRILAELEYLHKLRGYAQNSELPVNERYIGELNEQIENARKVWDTIPEEGKTPEALDAMFQRGDIKRGRIDLNPDFPHLITMLKGANASTFVHESAHDFLERIKRDAGDELAPDALKADAKATLDWLGIKSFGDLKTRHHEQFARGFEAYMMEGRAPSQGMANVFAKVRDWLISIYKQATALKVDLTPQIRGVYDRLLGINPDTVVIAPHEPVRVPTLADIHLTDKGLTEPEHADPVGDLVFGESGRTLEDHRAYDAEFEAAEQAAAEAALSSVAGPAPPGEGGGGAGGAREVVAPGGDDQRVAGGAGSSPANGDLDRSGAAPVQESPGVSENGAAARADNAGQAAGAHPLAAGPSDVLRPSDSAFNVGKDGNVRVENITSVQQFVEAINESSSRIGGSGPATMGDVLAVADDFAINASTVSLTHLGRMFGGLKDLAGKIIALRRAVRDSSELVVDAAGRAAKSGSEVDIFDMVKTMARHDMMQSVLSSVTTEVGRATGMSFRNLEGLEKIKDPKELGNLLQARTGRTLYQLQKMAKLAANLDSPGKVSKFLRDAQKRSFGRLILEYWINGLISGTATHMTYAEGNAILSLWKAVPETLAAAAVGKAKAVAGFTGERVRFGEAAAGPAAMIRGIPASVQAGIEALRTGQSTLLPGETAKPLTPFEGDTSLVTAKTIDKPEAVTWREAGADAYALMRSIKDSFVAGSNLLASGGVPGAPTIGWSHSPLGAIPDIAVRGVNVIPVGSAIRLPGRAVAGIHSFFRTMNYLREGAAEAYRVAASDPSITTSHDFASKVADVRTNPTEEQMERWRHGATELALMGQGGKFVENMSKFFNTTVNIPGLGETAPLKFIQPFVHIGANVIKQAVVLRTPVGILSSEVRADLMGKNGSIAQDMAAGRMLAGTAVSVLFGTLAMEGFITGSGPKDPNEARQWREVYQAHSVKIGGMWYQVNRLGPMGLLMGLAADMYGVAHEAEEGDMMVAAAHLQHAVFQNILDESFMRGPADLIKAVEDPGRYGEAYLKQMISSFVPFSVGAAQMARAMDPYTREARTVIDAIRAKVPGMSKDLLPRRNIWGEEIPNASAFGGRAFSAIYEKQVNSDPVNQAMLDLGVHPGMPERTIRNIQLTDAQYDDFARTAGRMTKMRLDAIVRAPQFQTWPNHVKHDVIVGVINQTRESARGFIMAKYPQIPADATMALRKRKTGEP